MKLGRRSCARLLTRLPEVPGVSARKPQRAIPTSRIENGWSCASVQARPPQKLQTAMKEKSQPHLDPTVERVKRNVALFVEKVAPGADAKTTRLVEKFGIIYAG